MKNKKINNKTDIEIICNNIENIGKYNDYTNFSYDTYYPCQNGSDCCDNDYCRCGKITGISDIKINYSKAIKSIYDVKKPNLVLQYCLDRILIINNFHDSDNWELKVEAGYYGQEVAGVSCNNSGIICDELKLLEVLSDIDKLKKVLELEYGYLLESIKAYNNFEIKSMDVSDIILSNENHYKKLNQQSVDYYKNYELPRAIVKLTHDKYTIIDGYHRVISALKNKINKIDVIVLS